jgi:hypothetical protein
VACGNANLHLSPTKRSPPSPGATQYNNSALGADQLIVVDLIIEADYCKRYCWLAFRRFAGRGALLWIKEGDAVVSSSCTRTSAADAGSCHVGRRNEAVFIKCGPAAGWKLQAADPWVRSCATTTPERVGGVNGKCVTLAAGGGLADRGCDLMQRMTWRCFSLLASSSLAKAIIALCHPRPVTRVGAMVFVRSDAAAHGDDMRTASERCYFSSRPMCTRISTLFAMLVRPTLLYDSQVN